MHLSGHHHTPASLAAGKDLCIRLLGGWVWPKACVEGFENSNPMTNQPVT
jgi:hypothetical protein